MAKQSESLVKYGDYDIDEATQDRQDLDKEGGGDTFIKIKEGKTKLRFIPPLPGRKWRRVTYVHYVDVPGVGRQAIVCPRLEAKKPCPVCDAEKQLWSHSDELEAKGKVGAAEADRKRAKAIKAKRRCYANVIDRAHPENGPMVFGFGKMVEDKLIKIRQDEEDGGNFVHPTQGFDIKITRVGTGALDTEYDATKSTVCPLSEDVKQMNEWISGQHNLERYCKVSSAEDIRKILNGEKPGDDDDDDRPRRSSSGKSKPKSTVEDDVTDAEFEIDDEDDDE